MKIKTLAFGLSLMMGSLHLQAQVKTFDLTAEIELAQAAFGSVKDYPILIFNQDEIDRLFLAADAFGADDDKEAKLRRLQVIQDYVQAKLVLK